MHCTLKCTFFILFLKDKIHFLWKYDYIKLNYQWNTSTFQWNTILFKKNLYFKNYDRVLERNDSSVIVPLTSKNLSSHLAPRYFHLHPLPLVYHHPCSVSAGVRNCRRHNPTHGYYPVVRSRYVESPQNDYVNDRKCNSTCKNCC